MNTSQNENIQRAGGSFADGLTLTRALLTPLIMIILIKGGWPDNQTALIASALFAIAAITDIFDDMIGGPENAVHRQFGWFDDIADIVLVIGSLLALSYVIHKNGFMSAYFAIPAAIIVLREVIIGFVKGYELSQKGFPDVHFGTLKNAVCMLAVCILIASPWLTTWYDGFRATEENIVEIFNNPSTLIWTIGQVCLWIGAILSVITGISLLRNNENKVANDI